MTKISRIVRPTGLEEAWASLDQGGRGARLLGGGMDLAWLAPTDVETLIDLREVTEGGVRWQDGELRMGAGATLTEILESEAAREYVGGIVAEVFRQVASPLQRNAATLGGAIAGAHPWSDVLTLLLVLDARIVRYAGKQETCDIEAVIAEKGTIDRSIITEVVLPAGGPDVSAAFQKVNRTRFDIGIINCACCLKVEDGRCRRARVVMGGTPGIAARLPGVESVLLGEALDDALMERAAAAASDEVPARDDLRASAQYRRVLAAWALRECLRDILAQRGEER